MIMILLSILLALSYTPLSFSSELLEESLDLRCAHGGQQIPIVVCTPSSSCVTTTCSFTTTTTVSIPASGVTAGITVPGPSAAYTSLSISGTLTANQVCASNVTAANMESLFFSSGYYSQMSDYQVLRSNASIFGNFGNELIITATDGAVGDNFGNPVAISDNGSIIVVGGGDQNSQGAAYIYRRQGNTWTLLQEILDPEGTAGDFFGYSVISSDASTIAIQGDYNTLLGSTYLYQYNAALDQYVFVQKIAGLGQFNALSATGQYLVGSNFAEAAQAFVYVRNDTCAGRGSLWTLQQTLNPTSASLNLTLTVAISSDASTIALGVVDFSLPVPGVVQMYTRSGTQWSLVQTLTASDAAAGDGFGASVALSNNGQYALIGARGHFPRGSAYEFVNRGGTILWNQEQEFFPPVNIFGFGGPVAISGDGTVGLIGNNSSDVFVVLRSPDNAWTIPLRFSGHVPNSFFGFSVAISTDGAFMVVGAPGFSAGIPGSISIFRPAGAIIPADTIITGSLCVNSNMTIDSDLLVTGSIFVQGSVIAGGATPCSALSDRRLKKNIEPLPTLEAFQKIQLLRPVTFLWVNPEEHPGESNPSAGLIAQDVERDFAHWVRRGRATGKDIQLVSSEDPARLVEITPELYAYLVACIKGLEESDNYKDTLMAKHKGLS